MKLYLVIGKNKAGADLWEEYVSLCGVYTEECLAKERVAELKSELDDNGHLMQDEDKFVDYTIYNYEIINVETNQLMFEFLGGYAE